jgi:hydroxymethylpyrimidine pyrophosphatase-like HAD family hydrolase
MIALSAAQEANIQHEPRALVLANLRNDPAVLATLLAREVKRRGWLDAYLLAAGLSQIVDDHLHPTVQRMDMVARHLDLQTGQGARLAAKAVRTTTFAMSTLAASPGSRVALRRWRVELDALVDGLADRVVGAPPAGSAPEAAAGAAGTLIRTAGRLPRSLLRTPVRLPACFHSFDQHPDDLARLVDAFGRRWPARDRALLVVGVRTSGSYLAPLIAAELRARGYDAVRVVTVRPGRALARRERELVRDNARRGGLALLTDDPPVTGASVASVARTLRGLGVAEHDIVLVLPISGTELPAALRSYPAVILPWDQWAVHERLRLEHVRATLGALLACDWRVLGAERIPISFDRRGHGRACFRVDLCDVRTGAHCERQVLVEGVGLGYFGAHALAAAPDLAAFSPRVFGLRDGLLYREWLPNDRRPVRIVAERDPAVAHSIAAYVAARRRALPVEEDVSLRLVGEQPAWEVASMTLSRAFGRASLAARPLLTDRVARRLLHVEQPSVVDGDTDLDHWFMNDGLGLPIAKVGVGDRSFWHLGLACFDAAFDLAGATAQAWDAAFVRRLRQAYLDETGQRVDEERWLLYELAHLWGRERTHPQEGPALRRAAARALQRYFSEAFLRDLPPVSQQGPLCAVDVDGVLETEHLGFPSLTPSAARALRALLAHGYRPVLATGRSVEEIVGRCRAYGLPGAVGEYGAVAYHSADDRLQVLLSADEVRTLDRLRAALARLDGVDVDPGYRYSVRAFRHDAAGRRVRLDEASRARALSSVTAAEIDAIDGDCQTDFVVRGVDKGVALRALAETLGAGHAARPLAFAVGDTAADRPSFDLAKVAFAPAHARALKGTPGVIFTRRPYQAGFEEVVSRIVGHRPGTCVRCKGPRMTGERELLLSVLGAPERGLLAMGVNATRLWARLW